MARAHSAGVALAGIVAAVSVSAGSLPAPAALSDEMAVNYKFQTPPMNSNGIVDLADLRGRPVLIEFWGTR